MPGERLAARLGDVHTCPAWSGHHPHVGGPILPTCEPTVLIGGSPAARVGDPAHCHGPTDVIVQGSITVYIGDRRAARIGDRTAHGGVIVMGWPTVLIGDAASAGGEPDDTPPGHAGDDDRMSVNAAARTGDERLFEAAFKRTTRGLSLESSLSLYKFQTGKELSEGTVMTLFADPTKAKAILIADPDIHTKYREILNTNIPLTQPDAARDGFERLPLSEAAFHSSDLQLLEGETNAKYVGPGGRHLEAVYDSRGKLVTDPRFAGSFNFYDERTDQRGHVLADVDPWSELDHPSTVLHDAWPLLRMGTAARWDP